MKKIIALALVGIIGSATNQQAFSQDVTALAPKAIKIGAFPENPGLILEKYDMQNWRSVPFGTSLANSPSAFDREIGESREHIVYNPPPKTFETYYVHPTAVIVNRPIMSPTEKKIVYWASRTGFGFLRRRTGTYTMGRYPETSALTSHSTGPRTSGHSPR